MAPTGGRDSVKVNARRARARVSRNDGREEERERRQALLSEKETESVGSFLLLGTERDARRQAVTSERFFLFFFFFFLRFFGNFGGGELEFEFDVFEFELQTFPQRRRFDQKETPFF